MGISQVSQIQPTSEFLGQAKESKLVVEKFKEEAL
jgi:hypothetical protein